MASIESRPDSKGNIRWRAVVRLKGFKEFSKTFSTEEEAARWAKITEDGLRGKSPLPYLTLNQWFDRFEEEVIPTKNPKYSKKEKPYIAFWRDKLGSLIATDVTSSEIENTANTLYKINSRSGEPLSPETRRKYIQTLNYLYNHAIKYWKWAVINPASAVDLHLDAIRESQGKSKISSKSSNSIKSWKNNFLWVLENQLKNLGIPNRPGIELEKLTGLSKTSLQKIYDPEANVTLGNLLQVCEAAKIEFNIVPV